MGLIKGLAKKMFTTGVGGAAPTESESPPVSGRVPPPPSDSGFKSERGDQPHVEDQSHDRDKGIDPRRPQRPLNQPPDAGESAIDFEAGQPLAVRPAEREATSLLFEVASGAEHPALACDYGNACSGAITVLAGTRRGISHARLGEPRQDAYAVKADGRWIHVAVADGAGTKDRSGLGAALACKAAVELSCTGATAADIAAGVAEAIRAVAEAAGEEPLRYSTTLCWLRIQTGDLGSDWELELAEWGNSELVHLTPDAKKWHRIRKQFASPTGDTPTLPSDLQPTLHALPPQARWRPGKVLCIVSDGVGDFLEEGSPLAGALAGVWSQPPGETAFLGHLSFRLAPAHDDRTAVVLWRNDSFEPVSAD